MDAAEKTIGRRKKMMDPVDKIIDQAEKIRDR
jgi:hypothetical protein